MERLSLALLGGFQARQGPGATLALPGKKARALLAYLGFHPGLVRSREALLALLWGDVPADQARHSLRQMLVDLRHALPNGKIPALVVEGDGLALNPARVQVDVVTFEQLAKQGTRRSLERAAALYSGDLLVGFSLREAAFEEWVRFERDRLREAALQVLRQLLAKQTSSADLEPAMHTAMRLLTMDPLQEPVHRALMQIYDQLGRRPAALRQYHLCAEVLQRELGISPSAETTQLFEHLSPDRLRSPAKQPARSRYRRPKRHDRAFLQEPDIPIVGRQAELARFLAAARETVRGRGHLIVLRGEAGIGKTRLLQELQSLGRSLGLAPLLGACFDVTRALAFSPWLEVLRAAGVADDRDLADQLAATWRTELARLIPDLSPPGLQPSAQLEDYLRLFEAVAQLLDCLAQRHPLLVMLEDIHWADDMSVRLLFYLARRLGVARVLLATTLRTEEVTRGGALEQMLADLERGRSGACVDLSPLSRADTVMLVRTAAKAERSTSGLEFLGEKVWEISQGNPFFIMETLRALPAGDLEPGPQLALPMRVRDLIAIRLEKLGEASRRLVAAAAVAGRDVEFALLQRASGLSERAAADALGQLLRSRILREAETRFDFEHERIREVALADLIPQQRTVLHRAIGEALEKLYANDADSHLSALGIHYRGGEVWHKAVDYLRRAGMQALRRSAYADALSLTEQALDSIQRLPDTRETREEWIDLVLQFHEAGLPIQQQDAGVEELNRAASVAESLGDHVRLARVHARLALRQFLRGEHDLAVEHGRRSCQVGPIPTDQRGPARARRALVSVYIVRGAYDQAITLLREDLLSVTGDAGVQHPGPWTAEGPVFTCVLLARCHAERGEFAEATRYAEEAMTKAEADGGPLLTSWACLALGFVHCTRGDWTAAMPYLERGLELNRTKVEFHFTLFASLLGDSLMGLGRLDEALPLLEPAAERDRTERPWMEAFRLKPLAEAYAASGRTAEAKRCAERALSIAQRLGLLPVQARILQIKAKIARCLTPSDVSSALRWGHEALGLATTAGRRPLMMKCHVELGDAYLAAGRTQEARNHLSTAEKLCKEMNMTAWLPTVQEALQAAASHD